MAICFELCKITHFFAIKYYNEQSFFEKFFGKMTNYHARTLDIALVLVYLCTIIALSTQIKYSRHNIDKKWNNMILTKS